MNGIAELLQDRKRKLMLAHPAVVHRDDHTFVRDVLLPALPCQQVGHRDHGDAAHPSAPASARGTWARSPSSRCAECAPQSHDRAGWRPSSSCSARTARAFGASGSAGFSGPNNSAGSTGFAASTSSGTAVSATGAAWTGGCFGSSCFSLSHEASSRQAKRQQAGDSVTANDQENVSGEQEAWRGVPAESQRHVVTDGAMRNAETQGAKPARSLSQRRLHDLLHRGRPCHACPRAGRRTAARCRATARR